MADRLTQSDIKKLQEEIDHRKLVLRRELIDAVKEARAHGDLSENFEYHAAKREKNMNESRIRYLEKMIKNAIVITDNSKSDEVGLNKIIEIYIEEDDETEKYKLVTGIRGSSTHGLITIESPLGKAILKHKTGDRVKVKVNEDYEYYVVIRSITESDDNDKIRGF